MPFLETVDARIHYEEIGSGFPLLVIPGGGLDSKIVWPRAPFDAVKELAPHYRCIVMDLRNAAGGETVGPLDPARGWDMYTDDQLAVLDHLGIERFHVLGSCIGNILLWNLLQRVPDRVVAAVSAQPSAVDPEDPGLFYRRAMAKWAPALIERRPDISLDEAGAFLATIFKDADFVVSASRAFVSSCQTPLLVLPDQSVSHPYVTAMEMVRLAPQAEVSLFPWKDTPKDIELALRHVRTFLRANTPAGRVPDC